MCLQQTANLSRRGYLGGKWEPQCPRKESPVTKTVSVPCTNHHTTHFWCTLSFAFCQFCSPQSLVALLSRCCLCICGVQPPCCCWFCHSMSEHCNHEQAMAYGSYSQTGARLTHWGDSLLQHGMHLPQSRVPHRKSENSVCKFDQKNSWGKVEAD